MWLDDHSEKSFAGSLQRERDRPFPSSWVGFVRRRDLVASEERRQRDRGIAVAGDRLLVPGELAVPYVAGGSGTKVELARLDPTSATTITSASLAPGSWTDTWLVPLVSMIGSVVPGGVDAPVDDPDDRVEVGDVGVRLPRPPAHPW